MKRFSDEINHIAPGYYAVRNAENINAATGHENLGFLSFEKGFMPLTAPLTELPAEFSVWDDVANNLPSHYQNQTLRKALKQLPLLRPTKEKLEERYLCRASALMSILAHAYVRCERVEDLNIPDAIQIPWNDISERLARPAPFLSYIDLIVYNWKLKNPSKLIEVENLDLLFPTVNNNEEKIFYLTQAEILYKSSPIIKEVVNVQTAILQEDIPSIINGLRNIQKVIEDITENSFLKINPNPHSRTYVDPVIWAKTVAPFAVPIKEGVQGPSGMSSPIFHLMDTFLERRRYDTILGKEALFIRAWFPRNWKDFITAIEKVSLSEFIRKVNHSELNGTYLSLIESYSGKQGFLGVHKRKVYGYLQLAFKVGRSVTIGGFSGIFKERTWEEVDEELERIREGRLLDKDLKCPFATLSRRKPVSNDNVQNVELDIEAQGIDFRPGDRCSILPCNDADKINEILAKMDLPGETLIKVNSQWQEHVNKYYNTRVEYLILRQILEIGKLSRICLDNLTHPAFSYSPCIQGIKKSNATISLVDFLSILVGHGISTQLLKEDFLLSNLLELEAERMYSVSSCGSNEKERIELTVGRVPNGIASTFLQDSLKVDNTRIPFKKVRPLRFKLNIKKNRPIIMFAGGTGISPFKAFWEQMLFEDKTSLGWLFLSTQNRQSLHYKDELEKLMFEEDFRFNVTFTQEPILLNQEKSLQASRFVFEPGKPMRMGEFIEQKKYSQSLYEYLKPAVLGGKEAVIYVCGRAGFAKTVMNSIKKIIQQGALLENIEAKELFLKLFSEDRYLQDVFASKEETESSPKSYHVSEIVDKTNEKNGYWTLIDNKIYNLSEFKDIHPGGEKIMLDNAGRDATNEFKRAEHHLNPEIMSLLSMYYVGECKKLVFEKPGMQEKYRRWLNGMHLCTEMSNTLYSDYSLLDKKTTIYDSLQITSPYRAALIIENHIRFNTEYIPLLLATIRQQLLSNDSLLSCIHLVKKECNENIRLLKEMQNPAYLLRFDNQETFLKGIPERDQSLIQETKDFFKAGLKFFECYDSKSEYQFERSILTIIELLINGIKQYVESLPIQNEVQAL